LPARCDPSFESLGCIDQDPNHILQLRFQRQRCNNEFQGHLSAARRPPHCWDLTRSLQKFVWDRRASIDPSGPRSRGIKDADRNAHLQAKTDGGFHILINPMKRLSSASDSARLRGSAKAGAKAIGAANLSTKCLTGLLDRTRSAYTVFTILGR
jgi:hypothetical protein